jgi:hypothetical protein
MESILGYAFLLQPYGLYLQEPLEGNVKLYESSAIHGLLADHRETPTLAMNDWDHIQRLLVREPLDA